MNKKIIFAIGALIILSLALFGFNLLRKGNVSLPAASFDNKTVSKLFDLAKAAEGKDDLLEAKKDYQRILSTSADNKVLSQAQDKLYSVNIRLIFSTIETDQTTIYEVNPGDSLNALAKKFNTTVALIKRSNNLPADVIRPGQRLRIWTGKFSCIVDKSQNTLTLKSGEEVVKIYRVSTGKHNCTPVGTFTITSKLVNPVWYKQGAVVLPESPENILGTRWLGFNLPGYGIHGTTEPQTIGQQVTAGCVRMPNPDVEELYDILPAGTEVTVID